MEEKEKKKSAIKLSASFKVGAIALVFMLIGYEVALFVRQASVSRIVSNRDKPDTVFVDRYINENTGDTLAQVVGRRSSVHSEAAIEIHREFSTPKVETFKFNPNKVSIDDLIRLGFTKRQAEAIDNYRQKGGRFRRKSDFAKSYVVADSVYSRLEDYIDIPLVDINSADSTALDGLPGIGGWYAKRIIEYREELGGYSYPEQLMDIYRFDEQKYEVLKDLIEVGPSDSLNLWTASESALKDHPYIGSPQIAHSIVIYRENNPRELWTVEGLCDAGILKKDLALKLSKCRISNP